VDARILSQLIELLLCTYRAFPVEDGGKALEFVYGSRRFTTKGGLTASTATINLYLHEDFKPTTRGITWPRCSPDEVISAAPDLAQSLYCHLLCGLLLAGEVRTVFAMFAHNLVLAFQTLERAWEELCNDIRRGVLSSGRPCRPCSSPRTPRSLTTSRASAPGSSAVACAGWSRLCGPTPSTCTAS
jgi:hypothetical protein